MRPGIGRQVANLMDGEASAANARVPRARSRAPREEEDPAALAGRVGLLVEPDALVNPGDARDPVEGEEDVARPLRDRGLEKRHQDAGRVSGSVRGPDFRNRTEGL